MREKILCRSCHFCRGKSFLGSAGCQSATGPIRRGELCGSRQLAADLDGQAMPNQAQRVPTAESSAVPGKMVGSQQVKNLCLTCCPEILTTAIRQRSFRPPRPNERIVHEPPTVASIMAAVIVCPALANDPSMASGTATTTTNSAPNRTTTTTTVTANPGRRVWVRKRTIHLKQEMKDDERRNARLTSSISCWEISRPDRPPTSVSTCWIGSNFLHSKKRRRA